MTNNKTLADILAEMRDFAEHRDYDSDGNMSTTILRVFADRIEAATERERRNYQRLHECFWEPSATQSVVRQMLDAADDLRSAYPKESDDLEYFANALIKCAKTAAVDAPGNTAALRAALRIIWDDARKPCKLDRAAVSRICKDALSAPPRNCDVGTAEEQYRRFRDVCDSKDARQCSCCELRGLNSLNCSRDKCFARWAQMPYEEGGAK